MNVNLLDALVREAKQWYMLSRSHSHDYSVHARYLSVLVCIQMSLIKKAQRFGHLFLQPRGSWNDFLTLYYQKASTMFANIARKRNETNDETLLTPPHVQS